MYRALYRKWRSVDFDDVCGQNQVTDVLKYEVANEKVSHAYLFSGSRGTGKTSCAKILAKAVNCKDPKNGNPCNCCENCKAINAGLATDVIEMDAASNNGVDNVRDITEEIVFTPAFLKYRVYIIDEVHMMSGSAFNALLKTLEEPPEHAVFILATTELHKLPSTIVSRCQRFDFRRLSSDVIVGRLMKISDAENIDLDPTGARMIARMANGGMRDAISLLDLCAGMSKRIDASLVTEMIGGGNRSEIQSLTEAVAKRDYRRLYRAIRDAVMTSRDITVLWQDLISYYRDMMIDKTGGNAAEYLDLTDIEAGELHRTAELFSMEQLIYHTKIMEDALYNMQRPGFSERCTAEIALTRMCDPRLSSSEEALLARLGELESKVALGAFSAAAGSSQIGKPAEQPAENTAKTPVESKSDREKPPVKENDTQKKREVQSSDGEPTFRALPYWRDVAEKVSASKRSLTGILADAKAYRSDRGAYLIRTSGAFAANMIRRDDNLPLIKSAISAEEGRDISRDEFIVECASTSGKRDLVDEIAEAIDS